MFCKNCGVRLDGDSLYCHNCGGNVGNGSQIKDKVSLKKRPATKTEPVASFTPSDVKRGWRETREEYMARLDIASVEEARKYLTNIKALFWIVLISWAIIQGLAESQPETAALLWLPYIGLYIYFISYCYKILKKEKLPGSNAALCILFAPLSWFALYPTIANPLKIIIGVKEPPEYKTDEERAREQIAYRKSSRRNIIILLAIIFLIILFAVISEL
jgi:hypothetical protein